MSGNYPAGVSDNDPHFNMPSVEDEVFQVGYVPKGGNLYEKSKHEQQQDLPHPADCQCEQCECPF